MIQNIKVDRVGLFILVLWPSWNPKEFFLSFWILCFYYIPNCFQTKVLNNLENFDQSIFV